MLITDTETIGVVRFECDNPECEDISGVWEQMKEEGFPHSSDYPELIELLKEEGWTFTADSTGGLKCYCPECSEQRIRDHEKFIKHRGAAEHYKDHFEEADNES